MRHHCFGNGEGLRASLGFGVWRGRVELDRLSANVGPGEPNRAVPTSKGHEVHAAPDRDRPLGASALKSFERFDQDEQDVMVLKECVLKTHQALELFNISLMESICCSSCARAQGLAGDPGSKAESDAFGARLSGRCTSRPPRFALDNEVWTTFDDG